MKASSEGERAAFELQYCNKSQDLQDSMWHDERIIAITLLKEEKEAVNNANFSSSLPR